MDAPLLSLRPCPQCGSGCNPDHQYCPGCGFPIGTMASSVEDKMIGKTLPGGYQMIDLLSVGGMGRVYRAEQRVLGRTVAVKVIHPYLLSDENSIVRFMTEARAASQLNHPNSVSVIDFGKTEDGQPYLVMEFLRGKDLAHVAYEEGPLRFKRIVDVLRQVLLALSEAHALGIIHRDLKPENVILEPMRRGGDFVKVVDFGLAKLRADEGKGQKVTLPGIVCGTPDYMAPEQGRGDVIDGRSDLYAVGVILFQLLTGRLPFESDNPTQIVMMHLSVPIPDPRQVAPERNIPDPLVQLTFKALAKEPADRFQDALEFADALQEAMEEITANEAPPSLAIRQAVAVVCASCGARVVATRFCGECGQRLAPSSEDSSDMAIHDLLPLKLLARDEDLDWLEERRKLADSRLVAARIVAEAGAGKTRLLEEFCRRCSERGDHVVKVGPDPYWAGVAYHALRNAIQELLRLGGKGGSELQWRDADPLARRGLQEVFAGFVPKSDTRSPNERRLALAEALRWALLCCARSSEDQRVILAIDDLERIDGSSRTAFADTVGEPPPCGALVIATQTPSFEAGWASSHAARVLAGLPPAAVARVLKPLKLGGSLANSTHVGMRGVPPLYVEQVLRFVSEGGGEPPPRVADLIEHRTDTLNPEPRRVMQAIAILGDHVMTDLIKQIIPDLKDLETHISELCERGMVVRPEQGRVSLTHPLFREVVGASIPAAVRRELHAKAAGVLDDREAPIEARALHAYNAQDSLTALLLLEQMAERSLARGDTSGAISSLQRGLELARQEMYRGQLDDPLHAVAIFGRRLGEALTLSRNFSDAEGVLREALDVAGPSGPDRAQVLASLARLSFERERSDEAVSLLDEAIEIARRSNAYELVSSLTTTRSGWAS
jgi:serine/threonine-protein kinase